VYPGVYHEVQRMPQQDAAGQQRGEPAKTQSIGFPDHAHAVHHPAPAAVPAPPPGLSHAAMQRAQRNPRALSAGDILQLQRIAGNWAVQRMLRGAPTPDASRRPPSNNEIQRAQSELDGTGGQESGGVAAGDSPAHGAHASFEASKPFERQLSRTQGRGSRLPKEAKDEFEASLGVSLNRVRIHTGADSDRLNRSIQAKAFTHGNDIHFRAGEFNTRSSHGKHLLAHELTHTIQQTGGKPAQRVQTKVRVGAAGDRFEQEADRVANQVIHAPHQPAAQPQDVCNQGHAQADAGPVIRRKMALDRKDLNVLAPGLSARTSDLLGRTGQAGKRIKDTTIGKLDRALKDYWATRKATEEAQLLGMIAGLADTWLGKPRSQNSKKHGAVTRLLAAARAELPKATKQATYIDDLSKGQSAFSYLSGTVKQANVLDSTQKTLEGDKKAFYFRTEAENLLAAQLVQEYQLTDAELAAIKVYTVDDYKYINPAMEGIDAWLKSQIPDINDAKTTDTSEQGLAKAKAEGQRHGKMAMKGLSKLPDYAGNVFRGMTIARDEVQNYQVGQVLEYRSFKSSSRDESVSQEFITKELAKDEKRGGGKVGVLFVMQLVEKAKDVSMFSNAPNQESEVLMLPGTRFRINSIDRIDDLHYRITAVQVPWETENLHLGGRTTQVTKNDKTARKDAITKLKLEGTQATPVDQTPQAVLLMGGPGSGKSSILGDVVPDLKNFVVADPDEIKSALPEYRKGLKQGDATIASKVHQESKEVTGSLVTKVIAGRRNLLYDGTGGNKQEYEGYISNLKAAGYHVTLVMAHITVDEALQRVNARAQATGRSVPENVVRDIYNWVPKNFPDLAKQADEAFLYNNMVGKTEKPRLVWRKSNGDTLDDNGINAVKAELGAISQGIMHPALNSNPKPQTDQKSEGQAPHKPDPAAAITALSQGIFALPPTAAADQKPAVQAPQKPDPTAAITALSQGIFALPSTAGAVDQKSEWSHLPATMPRRKLPRVAGQKKLDEKQDS
jgi:predicted ABC-type ATPase